MAKLAQYQRFIDDYPALVAEIRRLYPEPRGQFEFGKNARMALDMSYRKYLIGKVGKCEKCPATVNLTLDHIVPLALLQSFGYDPDHYFDAANLRVLCKPCNMFKSARLDFTDYRTKPLLRKYLAFIPDLPEPQPQQLLI